VRILVANAYYRNNRPAAFARWARNTGAGWLILSEAQQVTTALRNQGFDVYHGRGHVGAQEVAIATRRDIDEHETKQISPDTGVGVAHARFYTRARRGRRVFYAVHANAAIQDRRTGGWRGWISARTWRRHVVKLIAAIKTDQARGLRVIVGGDFNWRKRPGSDVWRSPEWIAERCGLDVVTAELMWLLHDRHWKATDVKVLRDVPTGTGDEHPHPALLVELRRRK
jgi:hypothetical protein